MTRYVNPTIVATTSTVPGWRVLRVLDASRGWVVCQDVACWLTIVEHVVSDDDRAVVPGVVNGDALWPAHLDDLGVRIATVILEPGETITAAELEEIVDEARRSEAVRPRPVGTP